MYLNQTKPRFVSSSFRGCSRGNSAVDPHDYEPPSPAPEFVGNQSPKTRNRQSAAIIFPAQAQDHANESARVSVQSDGADMLDAPAPIAAPES